MENNKKNKEQIEKEEIWRKKKVVASWDRKLDDKISTIFTYDPSGKDLEFIENVFIYNENGFDEWYEKAQRIKIKKVEESLKFEKVESRIQYIENFLIQEKEKLNKIEEKNRIRKENEINKENNMNFQEKNEIKSDVNIDCIMCDEEDEICDEELIEW